jgi:hypothetical protein
MSFDAPDPPPTTRTGHRSFDVIISICALITSAMSMYVAYNNDQSLERLVHANSWPFLQLSSGNTGADNVSNVISFNVKNAGTGPARIYSYEFLVDGQPVDSRNLFVNMAQACCAEPYRTTVAGLTGNESLATFGAVLTAPVAPGILAANDQVDSLAWPRTDHNQSLWTAIDQARQQGRISVRACYCSVFDECWIAQSGALPEPLRGACPNPRIRHSATDAHLTPPAR